MKIYISKYLLASVLLIECGQLVYSSQSITTQTLQEEETKKVSIIINNDQTGNKQVFPGRTNLLGKHYWKDENTYVIDLENLLRHYENDKREINCLFDIVVCKGYKLEIKQSEEQTDYMTEADITIQNYGTLSFEKCSIGENTKIDNKGYLEIKLPTSKDNIVLSMDCNIFNDGYLKISGYNKRLPKITSNSGCVDYSEYTDKLFFYNNKISFKNTLIISPKNIGDDYRTSTIRKYCFGKINFQDSVVVMPQERNYAGDLLSGIRKLFQNNSKLLKDSGSSKYNSDIDGSLQKLLGNEFKCNIDMKGNIEVLEAKEKYIDKFKEVMKERYESEYYQDECDPDMIDYFKSDNGLLQKEHQLLLTDGECD